MTAISNIRWAGLAQVAKIGSQLISITVLARLLVPADYGLLAIATIFTNFAFIFKDLGTAAALIQRKELDQETKVTVFWFNTLLGVSIFIVMAACAPLVATFYRIEALAPVLVMLALAFPIASSGIVHQALLERESKFKVVAMVEGVAVVAALAVAIGCAYAGLGVYSLVYQLLTASLLQSVLLWWCSPWRPRGRPSVAGFRSIVGFSGNISAFQFVNYFARNADSFVIGRLLGASVLGMYSLAYRVMLFPVQNMSYVAARALLPVLSSLNRKGESLTGAYVKSISLIAFVSAPLMAGVLALRTPFVQVVFGTRWIGISELLLWLAPVGFMQSVLSTSGTVFMAVGVPGLMFRLGLLSTALQLIGFFVGVQFGLIGLIIGYLVATAINLLVTMRFVAGLLRVKTWLVLVAILRPAISASITAVFTDLFLAKMVSFQLSNLLQLMLGAGFFGASYLILALFFHRDHLTACLKFIGIRQARA